MSWFGRHRRAGSILSAGVLGFGLCLAVAGGVWMERDIRADAAAEFERTVESVAAEVEQRFRQPVYGLNGIKGMYAAQRSVQRAEFRAHVLSRDLPHEFPGVRGFGFIQRVARDDLAAFAAAERADGAASFEVRRLEPTPRDDAYVIKFVEPAAQNEGALGLDVGSEARRREAAERAVRTGRPTLTAAITLVQDQRRSPGVLLFVPVYAQGAALDTVEARQQALVGLLYSPIVIHELLKGMRGFMDGRVDFELFDAVSATPTASLVFDADGHMARVGSDQDELQGRRFHVTRTLSLPGRDLTLRVRSTPQFEASYSGSQPWLLAAGGALISALLAALVGQLVSGRRRAEDLAQTMTADLDRLAQVVRHTSNAVSITDRDLRITWINEGFTRVSGYTLDEARGRTPGELLGSGKADPKALRTLAEAAAAGRGCRVEIVNRAKGGREYWIDTEVQPMHDRAGRVVGFMEVGTDVTERRDAQAQLEAALRDNDALLRTLDMHAIVSVADRAGRIIEVNEAFCRISGYGRDELLGQNHRIVNSGVHPQAFWVEMWQSIAGGTPWRGEVCNRAKDGTFYWVDTFVAPFQGTDGRIEKYISIRLDITASKTAERELARERRTLANIIEGTHVGTWEWNVQTGATRINERWAELVGRSLAELQPTTIDTWRSLIHPDDLARSSEALLRHFNGELPGYECETRMRHRDGHWVWMLGRGKVFSRLADGSPRWMAGTHMDISARKQAEAALHASQAFLDKAGRIGGVGGWALDLSTQTVQWTDQTCRIHGVEPGHRPTFDEALGYCAGEGRFELRQAVRRCAAEGRSFDLELPFVSAGGQRIWVRALGEAEYEDGATRRVIGAFQDITARRTLESELRLNNEVLTSVLESLPCGLSVFDGELNLVASNRAFRRLLDLPDALFEAPRTTFESIIRFNAARGEYGPGDVEAIVQAVVDRARAPAVPHRFERVRPDGTPLEITGAPMPGGGFVSTYVDISERRKAAQEIERSAQLLRGAIGAIDEAFVLFDPDDRLVFCNDKYRQIYADLADLIVPGMRFEDLLRHGAQRGQFPAAAGRVGEWVAERLAAHRAGDVTLVQRLEDGRSLRIVERKMPDGHIVGFRIDITELVQAKEAAEQASSAKSQFLANMSHEIRTPMNAVLGMLTLLRRTPLTPQQADYALKTEGAARSLLGLLNDILDFSKVEAGKMALDPQPLRFDRLLRNLAVILSANVGGKAVEVLFDVDPALPKWLVGDAARLQQVLINLGGNAIKFTAEGDVVISVAVTARSPADVTLRIAVRDTGIGIAPENHERIFSGFTQAESSTTRRFGGTGLGLAISRRLVALMGGELRLDSVLGQGSTFHFSIVLPLDRAAPEEAALQAGEPAARLRALVVDDNPTAREVLQRMGLSLGWSIDVADGGARALELLAQRAAAGDPFDAVFVDWQMPTLDGWETSRRIRELGLAGEAPVVVMVSAHGQEALERQQESEREMLDGYLVKPVTASMLFDAVVDARAGHGHGHPSRPGALPGTQRLQGMRVLVAEDNLNNQQVVRELLEGEGAAVRVAGHGQEAVDAVAAAPSEFDIVLMDLQMPVLDGYAATSRIRMDLGLQALPIVAMTANAMASDREACLAAGMNDHVGKPFALDHLVAVLRQQAGWHDGPAARQAPTAPDLPAAVREAAAAAGIDLASALVRFGGQRAVYRRMVERFVDDLESLPGELRAQAERGDSVAAARALHTLKGLAATLGADALAARAAAGEHRLAAAADDPQRVDDAVGEAGAAVDAAVPGLKALLQSLTLADAPTPVAPQAASPAAWRPALGRLADLLQNADMGAMEAMADLQRRFSGALGDELRALDAAVVMLDFEQALRLCRRLMDTQPLS